VLDSVAAVAYQDFHVRLVEACHLVDEEGPYSEQVMCEQMVHRLVSPARLPVMLWFLRLTMFRRMKIRHRGPP
jgi:hypothetical protein